MTKAKLNTLWLYIIKIMQSLFRSHLEFVSDLSDGTFDTCGAHVSMR